MTLLILAGGMGSRFGGLKQMEPIGPNGEFIIDYSIYDAIRAGFTKVVFLIKEEIYEDFKNTIGKRIEGHIDVEYVFQSTHDFVGDRHFDREKPWGTAHAVLCAKDHIQDSFAIINADDFYGRDAFVRAHEFLVSAKSNEFGLVGYRAKNTIPEGQSLKRGVCDMDGNKLLGIIESSVTRNKDIVHCEPLDGSDSFDIDCNQLVSMNMLLFTPKIIDFLTIGFSKFLDHLKDPIKDEYLIPDVVNELLSNGEITMEVLETSSVWYGMTYREDIDEVKNAIMDMIKKGEYKVDLW